MRGRRLVADSGPATTLDPLRPRVLPLRGFADGLATGFVAFEIVSLVAAALVVHGAALVAPPVAAVLGAIWGYASFRRRLRASPPSFPPLPDEALMLPLGHVVVTVVMRMLFVAGSLAAVIAGTGHFRPAVLAAALCVPPLLFAQAAAGALANRAATTRHEAARGCTMYQTLPAKHTPARLFEGPADGVA